MTTIPTWTYDFVTATTQNDAGQTITQYTGWRAVLDSAAMQRYATCDEWDLAIVADDAHHGPGQCGTDCHDPGDRSINLCAMSVPDADERAVVAAANTALAEQGFRVDSQWIPGPGGTLVASLVPVILDPACAAYEPETAAALGVVVDPDPMHLLHYGGQSWCGVYAVLATIHPHQATCGACLRLAAHNRAVPVPA